jgi:hypothetical protein
MAEQENATPAVGSDEYNEQMVNKYRTQEADGDTGEELIPIAGMPEGGFDKFYDDKTGNYSWENHAKELAYRLDSTTKPESETPKTPETPETAETEQVRTIYESAGLKREDLESAYQTDGDFTEAQYSALEKVGIPRDLVTQYVDNMGYRQESQTKEALEYAGGEDEWNSLSRWAADNIPEEEVHEYNSLLASPNWRIGIDAMKVRMGATAPNRNEPRLLSGEQRAGNTFGYRTKSEMMSDMKNPKYSTDAAFRQDVMRKMQSATWDLDGQ